MVEWPIFLIGLVAISLVLTAVRAIAREDEGVRRNVAAKQTGAKLELAGLDVGPAPPEAKK